MKRKIFLLVVMLGMIAGLASCGTIGYYRTDGRVRQYRQNDIIYRNGKITYNGTLIQGSKGCPIALHWADGSIIRWGVIVQVQNKDGQVIKQYDLRIRQEVDDTFWVTGLTGKKLQVRIQIQGYNSLVKS